MRWFLYNVKTNGLLGLDSISAGYIRLLLVTLPDEDLKRPRHFRNFKHDWMYHYMANGIYIINADILEYLNEIIEKIFEYENEMENKKV